MHIPFLKCADGPDIPARQKRIDPGARQIEARILSDFDLKRPARSLRPSAPLNKQK
jgi:hypothetical protein